MTAKREAELEVENRMLREQVASLEKIIAGMQPGVHVGCAPYPCWHYGHYWYYPQWQVTCAAGANPAVTWVNTAGAAAVNPDVTWVNTAGANDLADAGGIIGTTALTGNSPDGSTTALF